jgi:predicted phage terminase large subunit-like protein
LIKREWFEYVPQLPVGARWSVRAWDCAFSEKQSQKSDPDWTASVKATVANDCLYLGEPRLFRKSIEDTATEIVKGKMVEVGVRYGMGKVAVKASIVQALNNAGFSIESYGEKEDKDKIARASGWINKASTGHVKLVGDVKEWEAFTSQWWAFPSGAHDDAVDAVSGAAYMLNFVFIKAALKVKSESPWAFVDRM